MAPKSAHAAGAAAGVHAFARRCTHCSLNYGTLSACPQGSLAIGIEFGGWWKRPRSVGRRGSTEDRPTTAWSAQAVLPAPDIVRVRVDTETFPDVLRGQAFDRGGCQYNPTLFLSVDNVAARHVLLSPSAVRAPDSCRH